MNYDYYTELKNNINKFSFSREECEKIIEGLGEKFKPGSAKKDPNGESITKQLSNGLLTIGPYSIQIESSYIYGILKKGIHSLEFEVGILEDDGYYHIKRSEKNKGSSASGNHEIYDIEYYDEEAISTLKDVTGLNASDILTKEKLSGMKKRFSILGILPDKEKRIECSQEELPPISMSFGAIINIYRKEAIAELKEILNSDQKGKSR